MLTKSLAAEWAPHGVRVNAVAPGYTRTDLIEHLGRVRHGPRLLDRGHPLLGGWLDRRDRETTVLFLASDAASFVTGETLVVDAATRSGRSRTTASSCPDGLEAAHSNDPRPQPHPRHPSGRRERHASKAQA